MLTNKAKFGFLSLIINLLCHVYDVLMYMMYGLCQVVITKTSRTMSYLQ